METARYARRQDGSRDALMTPELTDRQRRVLARLVAEYIELGEPVSSTWLADHSALGVSSATVRNTLARLEELGLVWQPHTSAGRVPTDSGYRLYVDGLLGSRKRGRTPPDVEARLLRSSSIIDLLEGASQELSRVSHHVGFAVAPGAPAMRLRHIEFVSLEGRRVLVVVEGTGGQLSHRVIETEERHEHSVLTQAANYINAEFGGMTLVEARQAIVERLEEARVLYDAILARALRLARTGLSEVTPAQAVHVQGAALLIDELVGEAASQERMLAALRTLVRMIEEKHRLVELLTESLADGGLTVVIGSEHVARELQPFSLVASTFSDGGRTGTVGVIGPVRMRYQRTIAVVDGVSQVVSRVLDGGAHR